MKKTKTQKGITLVALIITIVVLLILAAVTIGAVRDSNIIAHAQNAASGYNEGKEEENMLENYIKVIEENVPKTEEEGMTIEKILNKAYAAEDGSNMLVYYIIEKEEKVYLYFRAYSITTGEETSDEYEGGAQQMEIGFTSEFETMNIYVNGSKVEISPQNAYLANGTGFYITEDAIYYGIKEGGNYTAPDSERILVHNNSYDSKIEV